MNVVLESLILGVAAAIGWGIADFITAVVAKRLGILRSIVGVHVVSILATVGYFLAISDVATVSAANWAFLVALSVIGFAIYLSFYRALQIGPIAIVSPVVSAFAVVVIILALIFTGERLTGIQSLAAAASIGGIVLASVNIRSGMAMREIVCLGVLLSFVAMFGIGVWQFGIGLLSREIGWSLPIFLGRVITLAMFAPLAAARREWPWQRMTVPLLIGVVVIGLTETGGLFAFARGAEVGIISIVAAAAITYPIIPMLGGLFIFKEQVTRLQFAGLGLAMAGLFLLAISG